MIVIKSHRNYIDLSRIASAAGIDRELISIRRAEGDGRLWRAWLSTEVGDISKKEKDLLWHLVCDGNEAVIMKNGSKGWRRALK